MGERKSLKQSKTSSILKKGISPKSLLFLQKGETATIFVTGVWSDKSMPCTGRYGKDFTYVNEKRVLKKQEVISEVKLSHASAAVLTGGDPLTKIDRCVSYISMLKKSFGSDFHVSLECPLKLVTPQRLERLFFSGLDELRVKMDVQNKVDWSKLRYLKEYKETAIVLEIIPAIFEKIKVAIEYASQKVKYLILNEIDNKNIPSKMSSASIASKLLSHAVKKKYNASYVPLGLNDLILKERMRLRAKTIAKKYAKVTNKGTIKHGVIYLPEMTPCPEYQMKLQTTNKKLMVKKLFRIKRDLQRELNIKFDLLDVDNEKLRLTTDAAIVQSHARVLKSMKLQPALVEEYPTFDRAELNVEFL